MVLPGFNRIRALVFAVLSLSFLTGAALESKTPIPDPFVAHETKGVLVLYNPETGATYSNDFERAGQGFLPASTFKIPHFLIALDKGVTSAQETFRWNGKKQFVEAWNKDQSFPSAFRNSTVWVFQETARRIGRDQMQSALDRIDYGNRDISGPVDQFWLSGELRISALEQIAFLEKLRNGTLPFSPNAMEFLRQTMVIEENNQFTWRGKTGWAIEPEPDVGWLVGWFECKAGTYLYALNMDIVEPGQRSLRKKIVRDAISVYCADEPSSLAR